MSSHHRSFVKAIGFQNVQDILAGQPTEISHHGSIIVEVFFIFAASIARPIEWLLHAFSGSTPA